MSAESNFRDELITHLPNLRAFAISLTGNSAEADDLVQDALIRAWDYRGRFREGTNLRAWVFTVLRNCFYTQYRKRRFEVEDVDGFHASRMSVLPDQGAHLDFEDFQLALNKLSPKHREVLLLAGAEGLPYEEVARICGCPEGTVKSRVNRAREQLAQLLSVENPNEIGPDQMTRAALQFAA